MLKNILMVAPSSIPVFGAEAIVNIRLLHALSQSNNFNIDLISRKVKYTMYPYDFKENTNIQLRNHIITEVDNKPSLTTLWQHFKSLQDFGCVFKGAHWAACALPHAIELVKNHNYDYVLTKNEPSFLIGAYLKKHFGLKWVSTWNDPYPECKYPAPYGDGINGHSFMSDKIIKLWKRYADMHIFPSARIRDYVIKYTGIDPNKTVIIPHVINSCDIRPHPQDKKDGNVRLVSLGNIKTPRKCDNLIAAISNLITQSPSYKSKISLDIIGLVDNYVPQLIEQYSLSEVVRVLPPITYQESLDILNKYDIAVIIEASCEEGIFLPTKVSDYMSQNIPILSLSPATGTLSDLYRDKFIPYFADINSVQLIENELKKIIAESDSLKSNIIPSVYMDKNVVNQYMAF